MGPSEERTLFASNNRTRGSRGDPQTALDIQNDTLVSKHKGILQQKSVEDAGTSVGKKYRTVEENSSPIEPDKRVPENSRKDTRQDRERFRSVNDCRSGGPDTVYSTLKSNAKAETRGAKYKPTVKANEFLSSSEDTVSTSTEDISGDKIKHDSQVAAKQRKSKRKHTPRRLNGGAIVSPTSNNNVGTNTVQQPSTMPLCTICADQKVAITFIPCGHLVCCKVCASMMKDCPVCRKMIKDHVRTFMP